MFRHAILAGLSCCLFALMLGFSPTTFAQPAAEEKPATQCRTAKDEETIVVLKGAIKFEEHQVEVWTRARDIHAQALLDATVEASKATSVSKELQAKIDAGK